MRLQSRAVVFESPQCGCDYPWESLLPHGLVLYTRKQDDAGSASCGHLHRAKDSSTHSPQSDQSAKSTRADIRICTRQVEKRKGMRCWLYEQLESVAEPLNFIPLPETLWKATIIPGEFHHLKVLEHLIMIMITSDQSRKLEAMGIVGQSLWHRVKLMDQNIEVWAAQGARDWWLSLDRWCEILNERLIKAASSI